MPTYDYVCTNCDHRWELFQSIKANPIRKCPACGKLKARREIGTGAGILFKGSGFYQTDYRSSAYRKAAEADRKSQESASGETKASSTGSGESKPESNKPAKSD